MKPKRAFRARKLLAVLGVLLLCAGVVELGRRFLQSGPPFLKGGLGGSKPSYPVLFLGMSTTIGKAGASYPADVERILDARFGERFSAVNAAEVGSSEGDAAAKLEEHLDRHRPRVVVLMMPERADPVSMFPSPDWLETSPVFAEMRRRKPELLKVMSMVPPDPATEKKIEDFLTDASDAFIRGDRSGGEAILSKAGRAFPEDARLPLSRARMLAQSQQLEQAELEVRRARNMPQTAKVYLEWARYYGVAGRPSQQVMAVENALMFGAATVFDLAEAYMTAGYDERADALLEEALARGPGDNVVGLLATRRFQQGRFDEAEKYYAMANDIRRARPSQGARDGYAKIAETLRRRGVPWICVQVPVRGLESLRQLAGPESGAVFVDNEKLFKDEMKKIGYDGLFSDMSLGDSGHFTPRGSRLLAGNVVRAIQRVDPSLAASEVVPVHDAEPAEESTSERFYLRLLKKDKADIRTRRNLASMYTQRRQWADAEEQYRQLLKFEPKDQAAMAALAQVYAALKKWDRAEEQCVKALDLKPGDPSLRRVLARIYEAQKKWAAAEDQYQKNLIVDPGDGPSRQDLARLHEAQGQWKMAEAEYNELHRRDPEDIWPLEALADLYQRRGASNEAKGRYQEILKIEPANVRVLRSLARLHESSKEWKAAERVYRQVAALEAQLIDARRDVARMLEQQKLWERAADEYRKILEINRHDNLSAAGLAFCLHKSGRGAEAEEVLRVRMQESPEFLNEEALAQQREKTAFLHEMATKLK